MISVSSNFGAQEAILKWKERVVERVLIRGPLFSPSFKFFFSWVLSGRKHETQICLAYSCSLGYGPITKIFRFFHSRHHPERTPDPNQPDEGDQRELHQPDDRRGSQGRVRKQVQQRRRQQHQRTAQSGQVRPGFKFFSKLTI